MTDEGTRTVDVPVRQVVALLIVLALAVTLGEALTSEAGRRDGLLALAVLLGFWLVAMGCSSFQLFILGLIALRPALDYPKSIGMDPQGLLAAGAAGLVLLLGGFWLAAQGRAGLRRQLSGPAIAFVVLVMTLAVATATSLDPGTSAQSLARTAVALMLLLVLNQLVRSRQQVVWLLTAAALSAVVPLLVGAYQLATGRYENVVDDVGRVTGTFVHPNSFGFYLVLVLVMVAAVYRHASGPARCALAVLFGLAAVELLLTFSRGSWVSLVVGLLVVAVLQVRSLLVTLPVGAALILTAVPSAAARLRDLGQSESVTGTAGNSLFWRFDHWADTIAAVGDRWLFGVGPGVSDTLVALPPHNDAVRVYAEAGVVGLAAYLAFVTVLVVVGARNVRRAAPGLMRGISVGALACILAFVVNSAGANLISQVVILTFVVVVAAAGTAAARLPRDDAPATASRRLENA